MLALTRILTLTALFICLTSCGFTLRSNTNALDDSLSVLVIASSPNSDLVQSLESSLEAAGVLLLDNNALYTLNVGDEEFTTRPVTVNGRARAAQYEALLAVEFSLDQQGTSLIAPETISTTRTHFEDITNISGSNEELSLLREEMRQELVSQLMRRLGASSNTTAQ